MFNPQKVIELLEASGTKKKDFLDEITKSHNGALAPVLEADIRVSKLEKIADFFGVSIDTFFEREVSNHGVIVGGSRNKVSHLNIGQPSKDGNNQDALIKEKEKQIRNLEALLKEKDERIALQNDLIIMLKNQISNQKRDFDRSPEI